MSTENTVQEPSVLTNVVLKPKKANPFIHGCEPTAREYKAGIAYTAGQEAAFRSKAYAYGKSKGYSTMASLSKDAEGKVIGVLIQFTKKAETQKPAVETPAEETASV